MGGPAPVAKAPVVMQQKPQPQAAKTKRAVGGILTSTPYGSTSLLDQGGARGALLGGFQ